MGFRQSSSYFKRDFQNSNLGTVASFKPFLYSAGKEVISLTKYQAMEPSWDLSIPSPSPSPLRYGLEFTIITFFVKGVEFI